MGVLVSLDQDFEMSGKDSTIYVEYGFVKCAGISSKAVNVTSSAGFH